MSEKSKLECLRISVITETCQLIMEAYIGDILIYGTIVIQNLQ